MVIKKNLKRDLGLELPWNLLEKAHLKGRVSIIVEEDEILIKKEAEQAQVIEKMVGLGKWIFDEDSVTLQRKLREEWKLFKHSHR